MREYAFPEGLFCAMKTFLSGWASGDVYIDRRTDI